MPTIPFVRAGDDLGSIIGEALEVEGIGMRDNDVVVVAQKVVSKAENRYCELADVKPSEQALALAEEVQKDPRLVELVLRESVRVVRSSRDVLIVEHKLGLVMANAGIDQSNVEHDGGERALLLPRDPDASAARLCHLLGSRFGARVGVVINDSFGRPWRYGTTGVAIGAAGLPALIDRRGDLDLFGRRLKSTVIAYADEIAAAASLVMGQADEGQPVVVVRGLSWSGGEMPASALVRSAAEDLFR
jgi:coenzyme F420-0:L-glutamate ligase/coenzyme F420-1:gamma-L-glutamate ligase